MLLYKCTSIYHRENVTVFVIIDSHKFTNDIYRLSLPDKDHFFFVLAQLGNLDFTRNVNIGSQEWNQPQFISMYKHEYLEVQPKWKDFKHTGV